MILKKDKKSARRLRHKNIRKKISGSKCCPRLCVFRSSKHIYAQLIDDEAGNTLASASTLDHSEEKIYGGNKSAAMIVGKKIGASASELGIKKIVFDRNGYVYHGRIAQLAEGAREFLEF